MTESYFHDFALQAAPQAAAVANYCDHVEHNEVVYTSWVTSAGEALRTLALDFAAAHSLDVLALYAARLHAIEARNVLSHEASFDGCAAAEGATTWRQLQLVQAEHDRYYHPDVVGLKKLDQLRHYALHLAKIVGAFAGAQDAEELINRRLPDTLLFAIKLHTVMGQALADEALPVLERAQNPSVTSF